MSALFGWQWSGRLSQGSLLLGRVSLPLRWDFKQVTVSGKSNNFPFLLEGPLGSSRKEVGDHFHLLTKARSQTEDLWMLPFPQ